MAKLRGIFYSLTSLILATLILTLAVIISFNVNESDTRLRDSSSLDSLNDLSNSIEKTIGFISANYFPINVTIEKNRVIFEEDLPNNFQNFNNELLKFKDFAEQEDERIFINYTNIDNNNLNLQIKPQGVLYFHDNTINRKLMISGFVENYTFTIGENCVGCPTPTITFNTNPGSTNLRIIIQDSTGTTLTEDETDIDASMINQAEIEGIEGGDLTIDVNNFISSLNFNGGQGLTILSELTLIDIPGSNMKIILPNNSIMINFSKLEAAVNKEIKLF
ncbi:hypothetical protein HYX16_05020 [Candidatus Woesearchaeota archaeon]|nr:hypothetical protein [Candidatus Woesearchaeota archaeon]